MTACFTATRLYDSSGSPLVWEPLEQVRPVRVASLSADRERDPSGFCSICGLELVEDEEGVCARCEDRLTDVREATIRALRGTHMVVGSR